MFIMKMVPDEFIAFLRSAPVDSGVCCCGGRDCTDHQFVDQWDWSLSRWIDQINAPTHIHPKTGGSYKLIGEARMQAKEWGVDMQPVMVYQGADGDLWVRPKEEFDERFQKL